MRKARCLKDTITAVEILENLNNGFVWIKRLYFMRKQATIPNKADFGAFFYVLFWSSSNFHLQKQVRKRGVVREEVTSALWYIQHKGYGTLELWMWSRSVTKTSQSSYRHKVLGWPPESRHHNHSFSGQHNKTRVLAPTLLAKLERAFLVCSLLGHIQSVFPFKAAG